jgi:hypothetical protein
MFTKETYPEGWLFPRKMFFTEQMKYIYKIEKENRFQVQDKITTKLVRGEIACK